MDVEKEIEFFDQFGSDHDEYDVLGEYAYRRLLGAFRRLVKPKKGEACIDLGCGSGAFTKRLRPFDLELTGMDISPRLIEIAQENATSEKYQVGDILDTKLPAQSFDIVVYSGVLHHFPTAETRINVLKEGARLLRPGGRVFSYDPYAHSPSMFLYRDPRSPLYSSLGKTENEVLLSKDQMRQELSSAGFQNLVLQPTGGTTFCYVEGPVARRLLPIYNVYELVLQYSGLGKVLGSFIVCSGNV